MCMWICLCYFTCDRISLCRSTQIQYTHTRIYFSYIIIIIHIFRFTHNIIFPILLSAVILPIGFLGFYILLFGWFGLIHLPMHYIRSFVCSFVHSLARFYFNNFLFARTHIPNWRIQQWIHIPFNIYFSFVVFFLLHFFRVCVPMFVLLLCSSAFVTKHLHVVMSWNVWCAFIMRTSWLLGCANTRIARLMWVARALNYLFSACVCVYVCVLVTWMFLLFAHHYACPTHTRTHTHTIIIC